MSKQKTFTSLVSFTENLVILSSGPGWLGTHAETAEGSALFFVEGTQDLEWTKIILKVALYRGRTSIITEKELIYLPQLRISLGTPILCYVRNEELSH